MAKKRIRIYFDFDGTLTPVSGYEAVQTGIPKAFKDGVNTPEARAKLLKDKNFDGAKFGLEQKAKTFILSLIELKKNNPDVEIDMVIVSRNYGDYIRAILERGGIDLITFDQIYDTTSTFKNGKGEPVADQPVAEVFTLVALDPANHAIDEGGEGQSRDDQRHRDAEQADEDGAEQAGDDPRETDECAAAYPPHELENKCLHGMEGYIARAIFVHEVDDQRRDHAQETGHQVQQHTQVSQHGPGALVGGRERAAPARTG